MAEGVAPGAGLVCADCAPSLGEEAKLANSAERLPASVCAWTKDRQSISNIVSTARNIWEVVTPIFVARIAPPF